MLAGTKIEIKAAEKKRAHRASVVEAVAPRPHVKVGKGGGLNSSASQSQRQKSKTRIGLLWKRTRRVFNKHVLVALRGRTVLQGTATEASHSN